MSLESRRPAASRVALSRSLELTIVQSVPPRTLLFRLLLRSCSCSSLSASVPISLSSPVWVPWRTTGVPTPVRSVITDAMEDTDEVRASRSTGGRGGSGGGAGRCQPGCLLTQASTHCIRAKAQSVAACRKSRFASNTHRVAAMYSARSALAAASKRPRAAMQKASQCSTTR